MYDSYGAPGFLAAYNAGPGRFEDWRDKGRPLPAETRAYVARIAPMLQTGSKPSAVAAASPVQPVRLSWTQAALFAARADAVQETSGSAIRTVASDPLPASSRPVSMLFAPVSGSRSQ